MNTLIDKPTPFAPLDEWLQYREELDSIDASEEVSELKAEADQFISRLKAAIDGV